MAFLYVKLLNIYYTRWENIEKCYIKEWKAIRSMAEIYKFNIREFENPDMEKQMLETVSREKKDTLRRIKNRESYLRSLAGEGMIRQKAAEKTGMHPQQLVIWKNEYGKPYFLNLPEVHFNISHSGEWVLGILSEKECGIDVELVKEAQMDVAKRFFAKEEYELLLQKEGEERRALFYELWTLKERYVKYKGMGLALPFHQFCFMQNSSGWELKGKTEDSCRFCAVDVAAGYAAYACIGEKRKK